MSHQQSPHAIKPPPRLRLGDLLVNDKLISEQQLQLALEQQKKNGQKLGFTLIEMGYIDEDGLNRFLSRQLKIPYVDLNVFRPVDTAVKLLPESFARRYRVIILEEHESHVLMGMADPTNIFAFDKATQTLRRPIRQAVVSESGLLVALDRYYRSSNELTSLAEQLDEQLSEGDVDLDVIMQDKEASETPVYKLLHTIFEEAVQGGSSDIHIEPDEKVLRLRQRVDGVLNEYIMNEVRIATALVQRLKILANLDISEKRLPQDGRFHIKVKGHSLDVRISTLPVQHGEAVVMRLLDQTNGMRTLDELKMSQHIVDTIRKMLSHPHGMILVTGPTGSGKTTTLYAALHEMNTPDRKIITAEDPIEYQLPRINQVQINDKIDFTFSRVLRTALRQDPDVLMVGEMRDIETVQIGLRASMTGHLVLSTLHTNSAKETVSRLMDMGTQGYLLASSLIGVVAQRLVRKVCPHCKVPSEADEHQATWLESIYGEEHTHHEFYRGEGCELCHNNGYSGRIGVYELLTVSTEMRAALRVEDITAFEKAADRNKQFTPLREYAMSLAHQGITTIDEVIRICGEDL